MTKNELTHFRLCEVRDWRRRGFIGKAKLDELHGLVLKPRKQKGADDLIFRMEWYQKNINKRKFGLT